MKRLGISAHARPMRLDLTMSVKRSDGVTVHLDLPLYILSVDYRAAEGHPHRALAEALLEGGEEAFWPLAEQFVLENYPPEPIIRYTLHERWVQFRNYLAKRIQYNET